MTEDLNPAARGIPKNAAAVYSDIMDAEVWILMCKFCDREFDVALPRDSGILEVIKETPCPHCGRQPEDSRSWHYIRDFRVPKTPN
jgi:hypothetical protein